MRDDPVSVEMLIAVESVLIEPFCSQSQLSLHLRKSSKSRCALPSSSGRWDLTNRKSPHYWYLLLRVVECVLSCGCNARKSALLLGCDERMFKALSCAPRSGEFVKSTSILNTEDVSKKTGNQSSPSLLKVCGDNTVWSVTTFQAVQVELSAVAHNQYSFPDVSSVWLCPTKWKGGFHWSQGLKS